MIINKLPKIAARAVFSVIIVISLSFTNNAYAATDTSTEVKKKVLCPDSQVFSKMMTGVCWGCMLPMQLFGTQVGSTPESLGTKRPAGASKAPVCVCMNRDENGIPNPIFGTVSGFWSPMQLVELVSQPWCFPSIGGVDFNDENEDGYADSDPEESTGGIVGTLIADALMMGASKQGDSAKEITFYHAHFINFPLLSILDALVDSRCNQDGYSTFDIGYMTEVDPAWNDDETAAILAPDGGAFANLIAVASCAVDASATMINKPIDAMYWCAGSWGTTFPLSGFTQGEESPIRVTSLNSYKMLFKMHRIGYIRESFGSERALCGKSPQILTPKKNMWRHSMLYPRPESTGSCCHDIGKHTFNWGEHRSYPGPGETAFVYMYWKYVQCCIGY